MTHIIDRRRNPGGKSIDNRQRFLKRVKENLRKIVKEAVKTKKVSDFDSSEKVTIPVKDIREPVFRNSRIGGNKTYIHPGNKAYSEGDRIQKPEDSDGSIGRGQQGSADPSIFDDDFQFTLSREEFLDIFFEDLELPDLIKKDLKEIKTIKFQRSGFTSTGSPNNINVERSMIKSLGRRIALKRPKADYVDALRMEIERLESSDLDDEDKQTLAGLREELFFLEKKSRSISFIDPIDLRYNLFLPNPQPNTKAVMFCVMDVSGSMGEREKDIAKRFFMLLHLFLMRRYEKIELVFIRHHTEAKEVNEEEFFHSTESGGTVISTALVLMNQIIRQRYSSSEWNIYGAQASDGDNSGGDSPECKSLLNVMMPVLQYFFYIEIRSEQSSIFSYSIADSIWANYQEVASEWANFAMKRIIDVKDIFPVFREFFERK